MQLLGSELNVFISVKGESTDPTDQAEDDDAEDASGSVMHSRRKRQAPIIEDLVIGKRLVPMQFILMCH